MTCHLGVPGNLLIYGVVDRLGGALEEGGGHRNYYTDFIILKAIISRGTKSLCDQGDLSCPMNHEP